jgi:cell division protein FtsW (lipid II flippase)
MRRSLIWLSVLLLAIGFLGHYFAAQAIGGSYIAFRDHIAGFFLILVVTGGIIAGVGWKFWKTRRDTMLLTISGVQAIFGIVIYMQRFNVHG